MGTAEDQAWHRHKYSTREEMNYQGFRESCRLEEQLDKLQVHGSEFLLGVFAEFCDGMEGWGRARPETSKRLQEVSYHFLNSD